MRLGNSLIVDDISRLTTILLLGMDATPLNHSCNATTVEFGKIFNDILRKSIDYMAHTIKNITDFIFYYLEVMCFMY